MELFNSEEFFKHQQPLSFWIRVQFAIPEKFYNLIANNQKYSIYDDFYDTTSDLFVDIEDLTNDENKQLKRYWVDITMINKGTERYYNNFVQKFDLEDAGGVKNFTIVAFDRNWGNLEQLITFAFQTVYYDGSNFYERKEAKEETTQHDIAINKFFMNSGGLENIRIKFGYGNPIVNVENSDIYALWEKFKERTEENATRETPWIRGIITNVKRKIMEDGAIYTIEATSPFDMLLSKVQLERKYAIAQASPYNMLSAFVHVPLFIYKEANKDVADAENKFFRTFYNPTHSVPLIIDDKETKEVNEKLGPFDKSLTNKWEAEAPRNIWNTSVGGNKPTSGVINYEFLSEPYEVFQPEPRATLGTIINEILSKTPPKRFATSLPVKSGSLPDIMEIEDKHEQLLKQGKEINDILETKPQNGGVWIIDENETIAYRYKIDENETEGRKLIFYYGDKEIQKNKKIRVYRPRHHASVVTSFEINEDHTFELLRGDIRNPNNKAIENITYKNATSKLDDAKIRAQQLVSLYNKLEAKGNDKQKEEIKSQINNSLEEIQNIITNIKIYLEQLKKSSGKTNEAEDLNSIGVETNGYAFGGTTLYNAENSNNSLIQLLSKNISNKVTLTILGDPFWFFDEKIKAGFYIIKVDIYRPSVGTMVEKNIDTFLSGYFYVLNIKHSLDFSGYKTTLELQQVTDAMYSKIEKEASGIKIT